jgi:hypothetical protein
MILITLLSLFYILTARPSNASFNTHSGDSKRQSPERRFYSSSSNVGAEEGHKCAPEGAFVARRDGPWGERRKCKCCGCAGAAQT